MGYITRKTKSELGVLAEGGKILSDTLKKIQESAKPGVKTSLLDEMAREILRDNDAEPSFLNYSPAGEKDPYPCALCVSVNDEIVHGLALEDKILNEGDIVSLDIGAKYQGLYTDMAVTFYLGKPPREIKRLISVTRNALRRGVKAVCPGKPVRAIGRAIEEYVSKYDFGIVRDLVGHGVGYAVHEAPRIPNYDDSSLEDAIMEPGMCFAIEPMITMGAHKVKTSGDGWAIVTADGSLSAHAEVTVAVTERSNKIITPYID